MASLELVNAAARNVSEADIRALALAKVKTAQAYSAVLYTNTKNMSDDQLIDHELELVAVRKAMFAASTAFDKAV